jgi:hypothetical protein
VKAVDVEDHQPRRNAKKQMPEVCRCAVWIHRHGLFNKVYK